MYEIFIVAVIILSFIIIQKYAESSIFPHTDPIPCQSIFISFHNTDTAKFIFFGGNMCTPKCYIDALIF